jgi:hypothetical protein
MPYFAILFYFIEKPATLAISGHAMERSCSTLFLFFIIVIFILIYFFAQIL